LQFAYDHPVVLNRKGGVDLGAVRKPEEVETYLTSLLKAYFARRARRVLLGDVKTVADPAVDTVLESFAQVPKDKLPLFSQYHRISMAAENKIGDLLEEYLANQLEPKGWFWCCCNIIKGVDFFRPGKQVILLQVKNRDNSENSSSEKIRELLRDRGCPVEIQKWHRCQSSDGKACWDDFPNVAGEVSLSEQDFLRFLRDYPRRKH
jgi:SinI restriction endonuclease